MARSKSGSRSSRSRSASHSRSRSFSKSRSRSRSLSHPRKRRHSSRSRSRSYSPSHNRERNYPRVYQNRDNFRGNNRGYRRPYYFRNRGGRGFYPRGQYNRGGYVNYNRPNWQNYNRPPYSPRRGRSRSRTPKRRSPSPRSRSHSRNSDKSSSDRSRRSSSSKSSSSAHSIVEASKRRSRKEKKARSKDKRASLQTTGEDDSKETSLSGGGEPSSKAETSKDWHDISYDTSPVAPQSPERIPTLKSSVQSVVVRRSPRPSPLQKSPPSPQGVAPPSNSSSFRAVTRQSPFDQNTSGMSPPKKGLLSKTSPTISSLYGNPKEEGRTGDAGPYSKRYLEDLKTKASEQDRDAGKDKLSSLEKMKDRGSPSDFAMNELEKAYRHSQSPKRYKIREEFDKIKMAEFHKETRYGKEDTDELEKKVPVRNRKDSDFDDSKPSMKAFAATSKNLDPYDPGKWEEIKFSKDKDKHRKSEELDDDDLFPPERTKKEERAAAKRADQAQKAAAPDKSFRLTSFKASQEKNAASPPKKVTEVKEREKMAARDMAFAKSTFCISRETGSNIRIDSFDEDLARPSGMLAHERKLSRDLVHTNKKEADFRSIFQHIQSAQPQRSPSELFAQHIVTIVHHVKEHHFGPGGMTLNERFTKYLKKGADQEPAKSKKSPEIHRRIDISPTAFRKGFAHEDSKTSKESSHKSEGKYKDEPLEIERRKKHKEHKRGRSRETPDSRDSSRSREKSVEKPSKSRKGSKKHKKHRKMRERSPSPSTTASSRSPSSHSFRGGDEGQAESEEKDESAASFDKPRLGMKDFAPSSERGRARGSFQYRARGRGWGRGTFTGNSNSEFKNRSKDEEWDQDFAPKNKKYYMKKNPEHDEGDEDKWVNRGRGRGAFPRGRGRFLFKKPGNSPKWSHDKFSGEEGEIEDESGTETRDEKLNPMSTAD